MKKRLTLYAIFLTISCTAYGQWSPKAAAVLPANVNVFDISIVSDQIIWAVCGDWNPNGPFPADVPTVIRSIDGGETWTVKTVAKAKGRYSWDIHAFDANTACISSQDLNTGPGRGIFRTTDGGDTWTETLHDVAGGLWVHFFDGSEGVCINARYMARTNDGGQNWNTSFIPNFQTGEGNIMNNASTSLATVGDNLWFGTWKGRVFRSVDRGKNWQVFSSGLGNLAIFLSMDFSDEQNGLALYYFDSAPAAIKLARTTDGGEHWTPAPNAPVFSEIAAIPCTKTFIGTKFWAQGGGTSYSTDLGATWTTLGDSPEIWAPVFVSPEHGWVALATSTGIYPALYKWSGDALYGRLYVNQNATGANTGQGWTDAYTNLKTALTAAKAGDEIWVAEGTYKPAAPGSNPNIATFLINKDLKLYGGFAGTECYLSERDVALHPTVLSGDLNGDDIPDDFAANRTDNSRNVIRIESGITSETRIDGFTISNGQAQSTTGFGAGIRSTGAPVIRHCVFTQNYAASSGAGLFLFNANAAGAKVEHCQFIKNRAVDWTGGGGIYVRNVQGNGVAVSESVFQENTGGRGSGLSSYNSNLRVTGSTFKDNVNQQQGGGLWFCCDNYSNLSLKVDQCAFEGNKSSFGGGLYFLALDGTQSPSAHLTRSTFKNNSVLPNLPGWDQAGGGLGIIVDTSVNNTSVKIDSCLIKGNTSSQGDAGLFVYSDGNFSNVLIENCLIEGNASTAYGAGVGWYPRGTDFQATVRNTRIVNNQSVDNGGAVNFRQLEPVGVFPNNAFALFENCLIAGNTSAGAAVSADSTPNLLFLNSTIANNTGGGIQLSDHSGLTLQNTILYNPGFAEYTVLTNDVTVTSLGGNLIGDSSLFNHALSYDLQNADPLFAGPDDYRLSDNSPAIDKGVDRGNLPTLDLAGNDRVNGCVDIGAYESAVTVSTACVTGSDEAPAVGPLRISPNPVADFLSLQLPENGALLSGVQVFDGQGRLVMQHAFATAGEALRVTDLMPGLYVLKATAGGLAYAGRFVKL